MLFSRQPNEGEARGQWALCISQPHPMPSRKTATGNSSTAPPTAHRSGAVPAPAGTVGVRLFMREQDDDPQAIFIVPFRWVRGLFATMLDEAVSLALGIVAGAVT
jgi:hypothetical protein